MGNSSSSFGGNHAALGGKTRRRGRKGGRRGGRMGGRRMGVRRSMKMRGGNADRAEDWGLPSSWNRRGGRSMKMRGGAYGNGPIVGPTNGQHNTSGNPPNSNMPIRNPFPYGTQGPSGPQLRSGGSRRKRSRMTKKGGSWGCTDPFRMNCY